mmetsp:Transcript_4149/g.9193  ORF Transcript_4149/g.9193 Transcript_4149/m.9193 type:complete len:99 (+) Transcript_4149:538-834(+)
MSTSFLCPSRSSMSLVIILSHQVHQTIHIIYPSPKQQVSHPLQSASTSSACIHSLSPLDSLSPTSPTTHCHQGVHGWLAQVQAATKPSTSVAQVVHVL